MGLLTRLAWIIRAICLVRMTEWYVADYSACVFTQSRPVAGTRTELLRHLSREQTDAPGNVAL